MFSFVVFTYYSDTSILLSLGLPPNSQLCGEQAYKSFVPPLYVDLALWPSASHYLLTS
jgi:hypothetical protein